MNEFKTYHPIVNFIYFVFVIIFSCFFMHPVCLLISLISGFTYSVMLKGRKAIKTNLIYMLPMLIIMAIMNPLFNHEGVTTVAYMPSGNPLTFESIFYGLCAAAMIVCVICHFSCFNEVMTSDKFIYLFGKVIPSLSLVLSMTLRFVPKFSAQLKAVTNAQKCIGRNVTEGNVLKKVKCGLTILSIMTTWSLENAVETADSMKARGYGLQGRTAFSIFTFDKRDLKILICILISGIYTLIGYYTEAISFGYFPSVYLADFSAYSLSVFVSYFLLCMCPVIIEIREVIKWKSLRSKI